MWSYQLEDPNFIQEMRKLLQQTEQRNQRVIILEDIPKFANDPQKIRRLKNLLNINPRIDAEGSEYANAKIRNLSSEFPNSAWLETSKLPFLQFAPFGSSGQLAYSDNHHLNEVGSQLYADAVGMALNELLSRND